MKWELFAIPTSDRDYTGIAVVVEGDGGSTIGKVVAIEYYHRSHGIGAVRPVRYEIGDTVVSPLPLEEASEIIKEEKDDAFSFSYCGFTRISPYELRRISKS